MPSSDVVGECVYCERTIVWEQSYSQIETSRHGVVLLHADCLDACVRSWLELRHHARRAL